MGKPSLRQLYQLKIVFVVFAYYTDRKKDSFTSAINAVAYTVTN